MMFRKQPEPINETLLRLAVRGTDAMTLLAQVLPLLDFSNPQAVALSQFARVWIEGEIAAERTADVEQVS